MNAADGITALERDAKLHRSLFTAFGVGAVAALLLLAGYCAGGRHVKTNLAVAAIDARRDTLRDTIRVAEQRLVHDTVLARATKATADTARATFASAEATVDAAASRSDSVASSTVVPAMHLCDVALAKDSIAYVAVVATLADMTIDRNAQRDRADADEAELKILKPPRFGLKDGIVLGATAALAVTHPTEVVKLVTWLVHLVP
jgi:hypothetical protein